MKNEELNNILKDITKKTYHFFNINNEKMITPMIYSEIFLKKINLLDDEEIKNKILKHLSIIDINNYFKILNSQIKKIDNNTIKAIKAIKNKDEKELKNIHDHMINIQKELIKIKEELYTDSLTIAKNRKWLYEEILNYSKFKTKGYLSFIDLDNFKKINDNMGHVIGDKVLILTVNYIKKALKKHNLNNFEIVRYAGDEFIILFFEENINKKYLLSILKNIQKDFKKQKLTTKNKKSFFNVSFSIGGTNFYKDDVFEEIIEIADKEMYNDKKKYI